MDIKSKSFSHSPLVKVLAFILMVFCFTQTVTQALVIINRSNFDVSLEKSYYQSESFIQDSSSIIDDLRHLSQYKNEEHILAGGDISEDDLRNKSDNLFWEFRDRSEKYNPNQSEAENYRVFQEAYPNEIAELKARMIQEDLYEYHSILQRLNEYEGLKYFVKDGDFEFSNNETHLIEGYTSYPASIIFDGYTREVFPREIEANPHFYWLTPDYYSQDYPDALYVGFTEDFLNPRIIDWQSDKEVASQAFNRMAVFGAGFIITFIYLIFIWGRNSREDQEVHFYPLERIYNDITSLICLGLITLWIALGIELYRDRLGAEIFNFITFGIAALGLFFVLSLVKHLKNRTLLKHTLIYTVFHKLFSGLKAIYDSGSLGVKTAIIAIGYPACVALTFFMFPITIGVAVWLSYKKVKEFKAIKEGVKRVKEGELTQKIDITGTGELARLADDINSITDGLNKAVENEIKSERLKTELITNVSHDIRTPLTSIITYVDLLKMEEDPEKIKEYVEILDQKSQRLKVLTDDLFEAAKASSGDIPVTFERIDIVSLLTQGLGELDEKIQERRLDFKLSYPREKMWIKADGRLLWRSIENLFSNIFKYAQEGSRVYVDLAEAGPGVRLTIKNISAYELNISATELMERFKRGDESRTSQGSGLGLSIVQSLIEIQKGSFAIEVDGDLFKAVIFLYKDESKETPLSSE
ncbi:signal transduction histidine kinase [Desulfitobacterium dichloroeliminans LMG P-21439]|uniref:histidine kinase n=1 Tax=Desulfitobacterium dichloroeliminans (strain LMG P-21439 / DCA1) TaxID=871963 RepID=L0F8W7_DESDL|nr:HAMP domain-containing sensor histidine kinase [Desulfitobacterium dichloroeliminans]AGA69470.1 signal transduction histidine kinase [Desulfitobacterium dichloroeliminans LMG P-21439]